jgi:SAM-dependent methyltransferase
MSRTRTAERILLEVLTGYQLPAVLASAERLGILDELSTWTTPEQIVQRRGSSQRGTQAIIEVLVAAGLAARRGGRVRLTQRGRLLVQEGSRGLRGILRKEAFFARVWADLDVAIRTGEALLPPFARRGAAEPDTCAAYLRALNDLTERIAEDVLSAADLGWPRSLLDVGGGGGALAAAAARRFPRARVFVLELPEVVPIARRLLGERGAETIHVVAGDALDPQAAEGIAPLDAVLVSHVLHDLAPERAALLLRNVVGWLRPDGIVVVHDVLPAGRPDLATALFDVMMLVENPGGRVHRERDVRSWLTSAGIRRLRRVDLGWTAVLRGIKEA